VRDSRSEELEEDGLEEESEFGLLISPLLVEVEVVRGGHAFTSISYPAFVVRGCRYSLMKD
jgi:hypothetical protein